MKHGRWVIVLVVLCTFVFAVFVVANAWPTDDGADQVAEKEVVDAPVQVGITLDSIDAAVGTVKVSIVAYGDPEALGPEGATLVTNLPGVEPFSLPGGQFTPPATSTIHVDSGDVDEYPLDNYQITIALAVTEGPAPADSAAVDRAAHVPFTVEVQSGLSGFDATADIEAVAGITGATGVELELVRRGPTIAWAVAMMAIYWMLASAALAVAVAILLGIRPFETRHLAWLTTIIFAFAAFRNTAPGAPPIGVFFDFASFFWAVGIVVSAELLLLGYYLFIREREN